MKGKKRIQINVNIYSLQEKNVLFIFLPYVAANKEFLFKISSKGMCPMESFISLF